MARTINKTSAKNIGSMKDPGRAQSSVTVNRNYGSAKNLYSTKPKDNKEEEEKREKGR